MARFPEREAEILALAEALKAGRQANGAIFPSPPVSWMSLSAKKSICYSRRDTALAAAG